MRRILGGPIWLEGRAPPHSTGIVAVGREVTGGQHHDETKMTYVAQLARRSFYAGPSNAGIHRLDEIVQAFV